MSDESDPDTLRKRVSELEEMVQSQQQTIAKMLPGRRGVLKGAGLLTGGALAGAAASERAEAQTGPAGQQGTSAEPNDMYAWDLNVANQVTSDLPMGGNDLTNVGAADIDSLTVSDGDTVSDIESGSGTMSGPPASANDSTDSGNKKDVTVTFDNQFSSVPKIFVSLNKNGKQGITRQLRSKSTSDFRIILSNLTTNDYSSDSIEYQYIAVES